MINFVPLFCPVCQERLEFKEKRERNRFEMWCPDTSCIILTYYTFNGQWKLDEISWLLLFENAPTICIGVKNKDQEYEVEVTGYFKFMTKEIDYLDLSPINHKVKSLLVFS